LSQKRQFFADFLGEIIYQTIISFPECLMNFYYPDEISSKSAAIAQVLTGNDGSEKFGAKSSTKLLHFAAFWALGQSVRKPICPTTNMSENQYVRKTIFPKNNMTKKQNERKPKCMKLKCPKYRCPKRQNVPHQFGHFDLRLRLIKAS
jgi:hypothetical protein